MAIKTAFRDSVDYFYESKGYFFKKWFSDYGACYTFVFKKNLKVTNLQYGEILSLIRTNISDKNGSDKDIQFLSVNDFNRTISQLLNTFFTYNESFEELNKKKELIEKLYRELIENIVVIDSFFGSCAVFIPYNKNLDIASMCAYSGYIHSCGRNIFTRRIEKITEKIFVERLKHYVDEIFDNEKKIPFTLYSHEDFTPYDRYENTSFYKHGLDDIKFYAEKLHFESTPLTTVINRLQTNADLKDKIQISIPGDYHKNKRGKSKNSIWVIFDKSIKGENLPGQHRYLICYDQEFINENQFHLFNENKPGWLDHTTIPHTLMGAMINISRPYLDQKEKTGEKINILDPFLGSGTTLLESIKYENYLVDGSDLNVLSSLAVEDNIQFFQLDIDELSLVAYQLALLEKSIIGKATIRLEEDLKKLEDQVKNHQNNEREKKNILPTNARNKYEEEVSKHYKWSAEIIEKLIKENEDNSISIKDFDEAHIEYLKKKDLKCRIIFYTVLKTVKRYSRAFERNRINESTEEDSNIWNVGLVKELSELRSQTQDLIKVRKREEGGDNSSLMMKNISTYIGNYSSACCIDTNSISELINGRKLSTRIKSGKDVIEKLIEAKETGKEYDLIITDPPYGFNTDEDTLMFAELYDKLIDLMIDVLSDIGQLVICLPERSMTGKNIYFFTQKEIIIQQIIRKATEKNREVTLPLLTLPHPRWLYKAPFYWESEKALRRSILHFRLAKR